jgi:transglutaminase-like putative cysteine protease
MWYNQKNKKPDKRRKELCMNYDIKSLQVSLPEDIFKKKWAGDLADALDAIDARLKRDLPEVLRRRLELEKELLPRMIREYPHPKEKALALMRGLIPDFSEEEFDDLERNNWIDFLYADGEKRYFVRFHRTLLKVNADIARRAGVPLTPYSALLDDAIAEMKEKGSLKYQFRIRCTMKIEDNVFVPGDTYRVHLPLPIVSAQTESMEIISASPAPLHVSAENHAQRTVFFEKTLHENKPFIVEYAYDCTMRYVDLRKPPESSSPVYPRCAKPVPDDLGELLPHIVFTPYLKALVDEILAGGETQLQKARKMYDFVTTKVTYSFMRSYLMLENHVEYIAANLKGDCGLQALLFITLCRAADVPARWQSGLAAEPDSIGSHDWAQFYVEPWGWLFCDCSYGGAAWRKGNTERWNFYFGNLDPYRMAANSAYQAQFDPPMRHLRNDPYDSQEGECETEERALKGFEADTVYTMISCQKIKTD